MYCHSSDAQTGAFVTGPSLWAVPWGKAFLRLFSQLKEVLARPAKCHEGLFTAFGNAESKCVFQSVSSPPPPTVNMIVNKNIEEQLSSSAVGVSNACHNVAVLYYLPRRVNVFSLVWQVLMASKFLSIGMCWMKVSYKHTFNLARGEETIHFSNLRLCFQHCKLLRNIMKLTWNIIVSTLSKNNTNIYSLMFQIF